MSTPLSKFLSSKIKTEKLSLDAIAQAIGVSTVSVSGVLKGKSKPNKSTAEKYAAFSGLSVEEILGSSKSFKKARKGAKKGSKATAGSKTKKGTTKRKAKNSVSGQDLLVSVAQAAELLDDDLAVRVHNAPKTTRDLIGRLLG